MKTIRKSNEDEMILEFLKGELNSARFNENLNMVLKKLNIDSSIIVNGDITNKQQNFNRLEIMKIYRGYPDKELFERFPKINEWELVELTEKDINNIYYINYDYWNELSNGTSKPLEAAKVIKSGKEIFGVSNNPFLKGVEYNETNAFPPVILITCNNNKYLIIEGHSRMTIYGLDPKKLNGTYAYIGHVSEEDMRKYDKRMLNEEEVKIKL